MTRSLLLSGLLTAALVVAPLQFAHAGPVEDFYTQGQEKFDAGEYAEAADFWAQAVRAVDEGPDSATRQTIMNLALDAYLRAYSADEDRKHVDDAKALLDEYEALLEGSGVELSEEIGTHKTKIDELLAEIAAKEEEARRKAEEEARRQAEANKPAEPPPEPEKPGKPLIIGGAVLTGVGVGGIGVLLGGVIGGLSAQSDYDNAEVGSDEYESAKSRGQTMNALAITGGVIAPIFLGAGIALLVIGVKKNKKAAQNSAVLPVFGPGYAGVGYSARF
ncbi:hypothetical protein G6O69_09085 [Pseudenhygromyxa sp. WMMC2535]|uniref:hypothetical protein n=1 Tax=Pseudenhygromyxa sp. WMMC2535 TaxID=2712867 RepID=UPI00155545E1|nr:hypothetical protein [Pseudenhygromyxa sp. WMMC2535]NVB37985.1 hypothetical protein [Pseudenhygromyxa sp. WMMC2535]